MPLGAGVDPNHPGHRKCLDEYKRAGQIIRGWIVRAGGRPHVEVKFNELTKLLEQVDYLESEVTDFYWQSSSAECPEDN